MYVCACQMFIAFVFSRIMERKRSRDSGKVLSHRPSMSSNGSSSLLEQIDLDVLEGIARRDSHPQRKVAHKGGLFFNRSNKNWLNPTFSSKVLEKILKEKLHEYVRRRFRATLGILCIFCGIWIAFFSTQNGVPDSSDRSQHSVHYHWRYIVGGGVLFMIILIYMAVSWVVYRANTWLFFSFLVLLAAFSWLITITAKFDQDSPIFGSVSFVVQFTISSMLLIFIHVLSLKSLVFKFVVSMIYIVVLEILSVFFSYGTDEDEFQTSSIVYGTVTHTLLLLCVNLAAANAAYFLQIRHHDTFWKITQCLYYKEAHQLERVLKEKTIHSLIPNHIANTLMTDEVQWLMNSERSSGQLPFPLYQLDNVSILFADIVGFTSLSATMSAANIVAILNDIFSKFDHLAEIHSCEKISTLGDCYFCVSGCPQADPNHASNIVDMGLDIVAELKSYKKEKGFDIDMRVGIHTGTVLSGVIGTKRFKYDVWSEDVTLAGQVERCGIPGKVVITEVTHRHISSNYICEEIDLPSFTERITTYCVVEKKSLNTGASVKTWKHRIRNIDVSIPISSPDRSVDVISYTSSSLGNEHYLQQLFRWLPCIQQKSDHSNSEMNRTVSENSIIDIFNRQSELEKCQCMGENSEENMQMVDKKIVEMMEKNNVELDTFFETSLHAITLSYLNTEMEMRYRSSGKGLRRRNPKETECSFRVSKASFFVDVSLSFLVFILCATSVALTGGHTINEKSLLGILVFSGVIVELPVFMLALAIFKPKLFPKVFAKKSEFILNWYVRTIIALFFIYYPMMLAYLNLAVCHSEGFNSEQNVINIRVSFYIIIVSLATSINFMEVSYLAKLLAGLLTVAAALFIAFLRQFSDCSDMSTGDSSTVLNSNITSEDIERYFERHVLPETIILLFLLMFLLIQVNRMSETTVRRQFNGLMEAWLGKKETRIHTDQANRLLSNILPGNVNRELRKTGKFSKDHNCVGVLFATIENLHDFRMEHLNNQGEEEYACKIRLLSEIVSHFDHLLNRKEFHGIEKIKTIGCTYMAASGLQDRDESHPPVAHLVNLINFGIRLLDTIDWVNSELHGHQLRLKIGLNYGPVTSGVVGTSKLLYDIWGDTVNVASRMESTGECGKIHLPKSCIAQPQQLGGGSTAQQLGGYFDYELHGHTRVKGKGIMETAFIRCRRRQFIFATIPEHCDTAEAEDCNTTEAEYCNTIEAEMCEVKL